MAEYRLTETDQMVIRTADGAYIPNDDGNRDWQAYQQWLADGGVPDPYVPPPEPQPGMVAPVIVASAHATIKSSAISLAGQPFNIATATYTGKGVFAFTFINALPDANYTAMITSDSVAELADGRTAAGFTINTYTGGGGAAHDPKSIDFQIFRAPTPM
ncbi:hypothetical protein [Bradyrhizobium stylosanthis]|uniref:hypothetical protein n=1 Tax=Bradyrhizobium stylosanthis TaxID=1803665 RepID=UPI0007C486F3|nr:hypothetical protein [Bradyrhizobium stylosanthis]